MDDWKQVTDATCKALLARVPAIAAWSPSKIKDFVQAVEIAYMVASHIEKGTISLRGD